MTPADTLRATADLNLRVDTDASGNVAIWNAQDELVLFDYSDEGQAVIRALGPLLAAAPHLADLLEGASVCYDFECGDQDCDSVRELQYAITEAGGSE